MSSLSDFVVQRLEAQLGGGTQKTQPKPFEIRLRKGSKVFVIRCTARCPRMQVVEVCFKRKKLIVSTVPFAASPRARMEGVDGLVTVDEGIAMLV